jgi:hypothetical protein
MDIDTPLKTLVRLAKIRWRVEHDYRELKTGLGIDHFEGRSFIGWHRHVTLAVLAQAFCTLLRLDPIAPCAGLTLYAALCGLQLLLAVMTGACHTGKRPFHDTTEQSPTSAATPNRDGVPQARVAASTVGTRLRRRLPASTRNAVEGR